MKRTKRLPEEKKTSKISAFLPDIECQPGESYAAAQRSLHAAIDAFRSAEWANEEDLRMRGHRIIKSLDVRMIISRKKKGYLAQLIQDGFVMHETVLKSKSLGTPDWKRLYKLANEKSLEGLSNIVVGSCSFKPPWDLIDKGASWSVDVSTYGDWRKDKNELIIKGIIKPKRYLP